MQEAGTSTMKTQLTSKRGDRGSRTRKKHQMALRHCKGSKRKGANGTLTHVVSAFVCQLLFFCLDYYGFKFLYKIKVTEAELSANCRTRDSTKGALLERKF